MEYIQERAANRDQMWAALLREGGQVQPVDQRSLLANRVHNGNNSDGALLLPRRPHHVNEENIAPVGNQENPPPARTAPARNCGKRRRD